MPTPKRKRRVNWPKPSARTRDAAMRKAHIARLLQVVRNGPTRGDMELGDISGCGYPYF